MHKNKPALLVVFIVFFFSLLSLTVYAGNAEAANLSIRCRDDGSACSSDPDNVPLFNETNVVPGQAISKTFDARNERSGICDLKLSVTSGSANSDFSKNMFTSISSGAGDEYGVSLNGKATSAKSFSDMVANSPLDLGSIDPNNTKSFSWNVKLSENASNLLQGAKMNFDVDFNFQCDTPSEGSSGSNGGESSSPGTTIVPTIAGKTVTRTPTPTPATSFLGRLTNRLGSGIFGGSVDFQAVQSPGVSPEVAGDSTPAGNSSTTGIGSSFLCSWLWLLVIILLCIIAYLLLEKYRNSKNKP